MSAASEFDRAEPDQQMHHRELSEKRREQSEAETLLLNSESPSPIAALGFMGYTFLVLAGLLDLVDFVEESSGAGDPATSKSQAVIAGKVRSR